MQPDDNVWKVAGKEKKTEKRTTTKQKGKQAGSSAGVVASPSSKKLDVHVSKARAAAQAMSAISVDEDSAMAGQALADRVMSAAEALRNTDFWKDFVVSMGTLSLEGKAGTSTSISTPASAPLRAFRHLLVLGVGSFASHPSALLQMALAYLLLQTYVVGERVQAGKQDACQSEEGGTDRDVEATTIGSHLLFNGSAYDPVFSPLERRVCATLGFRILPDQEGRYDLQKITHRTSQSRPYDSSPVSILVTTSASTTSDSSSTPVKVTETVAVAVAVAEEERGRKEDDVDTLCFLPHCPYVLYGNLLWANWARLSRIVVVGNSFRRYSLQIPTYPATKPSSSIEEKEKCCEVASENTREEAGAARIIPPVDCLALAVPYAMEVALLRPTHAKAAHGVSHCCQDAAGRALAHLDIAFNDTSLTWFPQAALSALPARPSEASVERWTAEHRHLG